MAFAITHNTPANAPQREARLKKGMDEFFAALGQGINAYMERNARVREIERLSAMSDEELLKLGVRRERIAYHVFQDRFWF